MPQFPPEVYSLIDAAIAEDQTFNDPTTAALVPAEIRGVGMLRAKANGVLAGVDVGLAVFRRVEPELELETHQCLKLLRPLYGQYDAGDLWVSIMSKQHRHNLGMIPLGSDRPFTTAARTFFIPNLAAHTSATSCTLEASVSKSFETKTT